MRTNFPQMECDLAVSHEPVWFETERKANSHSDWRSLYACFVESLLKTKKAGIAPGLYGTANIPSPFC